MRTREKQIALALEQTQAADCKLRVWMCVVLVLFHLVHLCLKVYKFTGQPSSDLDDDVMNFVYDVANFIYNVVPTEFSTLTLFVITAFKVPWPTALLFLNLSYFCSSRYLGEFKCAEPHVKHELDTFLTKCAAPCEPLKGNNATCVKCRRDVHAQFEKKHPWPSLCDTLASNHKAENSWFLKATNRSELLTLVTNNVTTSTLALVKDGMKRMWHRGADMLFSIKFHIYSQGLEQFVNAFGAPCSIDCSHSLALLNATGAPCSIDCSHSLALLNATGAPCSIDRSLPCVECGPLLKIYHEWQIQLVLTLWRKLFMFVFIWNKVSLTLKIASALPRVLRRFRMPRWTAEPALHGGFAVVLLIVCNTLIFNGKMDSWQVILAGSQAYKDSWQQYGGSALWTSKVVAAFVDWGSTTETEVSMFEVVCALLVTKSFLSAFCQGKWPRGLKDMAEDCVCCVSYACSAIRTACSAIRTACSAMHWLTEQLA